MEEGRFAKNRRLVAYSGSDRKPRLSAHAAALWQDGAREPLVHRRTARRLVPPHQEDFHEHNEYSGTDGFASSERLQHPRTAHHVTRQPSIRRFRLPSVTSGHLRRFLVVRCKQNLQHNSPDLCDAIYCFRCGHPESFRVQKLRYTTTTPLR